MKDDKSEIIYQCVQCGHRDSKEVFDERDGRCPMCGYHVYKKIRPPIVKRVKAV